MKRFLLVAAICCISFSLSQSAMAGTKTDKRVAYTLRNMHLDKATAAAFEPILRAYLAEKKAAEKPYEDLKDKYKSAEKSGTLTDAQATQLLDAKLVADSAEVVVKKKWRKEFAKVLRPKQIWYAFDYAGDKMSKIEGKK